MGALCYLSAQERSPFVGLPAFVSRAFRHDMVYVNSNARISDPADLNGKRIGVREWGMTALLWVIGILSDHHGLDLRSIRWHAARPARVPVPLTNDISVRLLGSDESLVTMLESGELDAAMVLEAPASWRAAGGPVERLFARYAEAERRYYRLTQVHPIMHGVVLRRDVYRAHPALIGQLYDALCVARQQAVDAVFDSGVPSALVPFLPSAMDETRAMFADDLWPYGVSGNYHTLECLLRYAHEQAITPHRLAVEALFAAELHES